jgi:hypothetical protein
LKDLRGIVAKRASWRCEYCLVPEQFATAKHEPDHILPRQHGGKTELSNLAFACMLCNRRKGPNIGSIDPDTQEFVHFFNPRTQLWHEHFDLDTGIITPKTPEARVTVKILHVNDLPRRTIRSNIDNH